MKYTYLGLNRSVQSVLASSRIGNLVTLSYLNRFNLSDFPNSNIFESAEENLSHILLYFNALKVI